MRENRFNADLDIVKEIFRWCRSVKRVQWRVSASGMGFHIRWTCTKKRYCLRCCAIEKRLDDPVRYLLDNVLRKPYQRRILWDKKGNKRAGTWVTVNRKA